MAANHVLSFEVQAHLDRASVDRALNQFRQQAQGTSVKFDVDTGSATGGLNKLSGGAAATQSALRALQNQTVATNLALSATVNVGGRGVDTLANLAQQAGLAARRFVAMAAAAGAISLVVRSFREGVSAAVQFDLAMNKVAQVSSETPDKISRIRAEVSSLARELGVSSAELAETAVTLKQAGLSAAETSAALRAIAQSDLTPTFGSMRQSTEGLIAALRQFKLEAKDYETTLGAMNAVSAAYAVESADLIAAVQKTGGAFKQTGGDLNEFMGLFTSVRATTREGAEEIATGLRTVFTRLQRTTTVEALKDLQINLRYSREEAAALGDIKLENQFVGAYEAVKRLSEGLAGLRTSDPRYAAVIEQLGGYRQVSRVIPLLKQFEDAEKAKNVAIAGGISLQAAAEKRQEALANKLDKLREQYLATFRAIVETKGFQAMADSFIGLASGLAKVLDYAKPLIPVLTALAAVKFAVSLPGIVASARSSFFAPVGSALPPVRRARGGSVPGSGDGDTVPALLTPGEFVLRKDAVARIGADNLRALNEGDRARVERFAAGGLVGGERRFAKGGFVFGDLSQDQQKLVAANLELVDKAVAKAMRKQSVATTLGEQGVYDAAFDALARSVKKYDPVANPDVPFAAYAKQNIAFGIQDAGKKQRALTGVIDDLPLAASGLGGGGTSTPVDILIAREEREAVRRAVGGDLSIGSSPNPKSKTGLSYEDVAATAKGLGVRTGGLSTGELTERVADRIRGRILEQRAQDADVRREAGFVGPPLPLGGVVAAGAPGPDPRDEKFSQLNSLRRDGTRVLPLSGLKDLGLPPVALSSLTAEARDVANQAGKLADAMGGATGVVVQMKGGLARVVGVKDFGQRSTLPTLPIGPPAGVAGALASFGGVGGFPSPVNPADIEAALRRQREEQARFAGEARTRDLQRQALARANTPADQRRAQELAYQDLSVQRAAEQRRDAERARRRAGLTPDQVRDRERFVANVGMGEAQRQRDRAYQYEHQFGPGPTFVQRFAGFAGGVRERVAGFASAAGARYAAANERFGTFAGRYGFGAGSGTAALLAAPLAADQFDRAAGNVQDRVAAGTTGRYTGYKLAGGALQGAVLGGVAGTVGGPIGIAVGAVVGGLAGLVLSLNEASSDIAKAKVNNSLTAFADRLTSANNALSGGIGAVDFKVLAEVRSNLVAEREQQVRLDRDAATHTFGGFDGQEYAAIRRRSDRQNFGQQLPAISQFLDRQAVELGRNNLGEKPGALFGRLRGGNNGLNQDLLGLVADVRGLSPDTLRKDVEKNIAGAQRAKVVEDRVAAAKSGQEVNVNTFGRLLLAVEASSDSLGGLRAKAQALGDAFDGTVGAIKVTGAGSAVQLGREDRAGVRAFDAIAAVGGEPGARLRESATVADDLSRVLPGVLAAAVADRGSEKDAATLVNDGLIKALNLEGKSVPPQVQNALNSVHAELSALTRDSEKPLVDAARTDVTKLSEKLLANTVDPVKELGGKTAQRLQDNANEFIDGLALLNRQMRTVGEVRDQAADLGVGAFRTDLQVRSARQGRAVQALDFASAADLEAGVRARQERLAREGGVAANFAADPQALARRLEEVTKQIPAAIDRQQAAAAAGKPGEAQAAALNLSRLQGQANSLTLALKNLSDVTTRTAVIQEKLNRLQQEKEGRRGLVERFLTADGDQATELNRGLLLANQANNQGNFNGLLPQDIKAALDFLRSAGGATLGGFKGAPRADDLINKLLDAAGAGLPVGKRKDEEGLQDELVKRTADAALAAEKYAQSLEQSSKRYFDNLTAQQETFFTTLAVQLSQIDVADARNRAVRSNIEGQEAEALVKDRDLLKQVGFSSGSQVKDNVEAVTKYAEATSVILDRQRQAAGVGDVVDKTLGGFPVAANRLPSAFVHSGPGPQPGREFSSSVLDELNGYLRKNFEGLDEDARGRVIEGVKRGYFLQSKDGNGIAPERRQDALRQGLKQALVVELASGTDTAYGKAVTRQVEAHGQLSGIKGFNFGKLNEAAGDPEKLKNLTKALESFRDGKSFDGLDEKAKRLADEFRGLGEAVKAVEASLKAMQQRVQDRQDKAKDVGLAVARGVNPTIFRADGGPIFRPRGTDTVPAMLTPGEFVVRRQAADANRELLELINGSNGPVYKADGGMVGLFKKVANGITDGVKGAGEWGADRVLGGDGAAADLKGERERRVNLDRLMAERRAMASRTGPQYRASGGFVASAMTGVETADRNDHWDRYGRRVKLWEKDVGRSATSEERQKIADEVRKEVNEARALRAVQQGVIPPVRPIDDAGRAPGPWHAPNPQDYALKGPVRERNASYPADTRRGEAVGTIAGFSGYDLNDFNFNRDPEPDYPVGPRGRERFAHANPHSDAAVRMERALAKAQGRTLTRAQEDEIASRAQAVAPKVDPSVDAALRVERALAKAKGRAFTPEDEARTRAGVDAATAKSKAFDEARARAAVPKKGRDIPNVPPKAPNPAKVDPLAALPADLRAEAEFEAKVNPYGASALLKAGPKAGKLAQAGQIADFNRRSYAANYGNDPVAEASFAARQTYNQAAARRAGLYREKEDARRRKVRRFAEGGPVTGMGMDDSVPAMLTPGEFVLRQSAVQRAGMANLQRFNNGGPVYLAGGGEVPAQAGQKGGPDLSQAAASMANSVTQFVQATGGFGQTAAQLSQVLTAFGGPAQALSEALAAFPRSMSGQFTHTVLLNHSGGEFLAKLQPEIESLVTAKVKVELNKAFKDALPDAGVHLR